MNVFIDASVYIAGIASSNGASHIVLTLVEQQKVSACITSILVREVIHNLSRKFSEKHVMLFRDFLIKSNIKKVDITPEDIQLWHTLTVEKDVHVIASAHKAHVDVLITLDKKHLLSINPDMVPFKIQTPREFLELLIMSQK